MFLGFNSRTNDEKCGLFSLKFAMDMANRMQAEMEMASETERGREMEMASETLGGREMEMARKIIMEEEDRDNRMKIE
jgi:hypothetical protein